MRTGSNRSRIAVIGSGTWGTTLALVAARAGRDVTLHARTEDRAHEMRQSRHNARYLPDYRLPENMRITSDFEEACDGAGLIALVVPSHTMRATARVIASLVDEAIVISAAKGLERGTLSRMTQILRDELAPETHRRICALSGPNLALEIAAGQPAASVIAGSDHDVTARARDLLMTERFRCYTHDDLIGVEMGGALKNIIAIGAGIGDGLAVGHNATAAFITRGVAEIARLGIAVGANPLTFAGLTGIGDLIATCASPLSRNHQVGRRLAAGQHLAEIQASMTQVAEGIITTEAATELGRQHAVELPITEQMNAVLFGGKSPHAAIADLMGREAKAELDDLRTLRPGTDNPA